ncbi:MAG: bifunctional folylpolyglutamate synthase/dihydrofolate synthase [Candidatus Marinimicrobia bacterium]|nr:bifunctional folylpolyglutamate synthase/dihydrofolate synthase [Candidatus Neomarinimicrobiota bacterium]
MDSIQYLLSIETRGIKLGLQRTRDLMAACGNPQSRLSSIQVAGTNGKGSVCAMLANIFKTAGYKTGLFTSPHLVHVNERIRINGIPISDSDIDKFIRTHKSQIENVEATFFETITAMAFWYFKNEEVDIAILETGLGGRLDSVSVCDPLATVITPISLDHVEILGETISEIAFEKAGILKNGIPCISAKQKSEVADVLIKESQRINAPIHFVNDKLPSEVKVNIPGSTQQENAQLAVSALKYINNFDIQKSTLKNGLQSVKWFGRNQHIQENPLVIFDVAHNIESIRSFLDYYSTMGVSGNSVLIIALQARKHIQPLVSKLIKVFNHIICTETPGRNPMSAKVLGEYFNNTNQFDIISYPEKAIQLGLEKLKPQDGMAIIGSHCLGSAVSKVFKITFDKY